MSAIQRINPYWQRLTQPSSKLSASKQQQAKTLTIFILLAMFTVLIVLPIMDKILMSPEQLGGTAIATGGIFLGLLGLYVVSRSPYYKISGFLCIIFLDVSVFVIASRSGSNLLAYLLFPILLSSILFTWHVTLLVLVSNLFYIILIANFTALLDFSAALELSVFIIWMSIFLLIAANYRYLLERRSQEELERRVAERTVELITLNKSLVQMGVERDRTETAFRESNAKFQALTELTSALIFIYEDDKIQYVNPASKVMTGYSQEELLALDFWGIVDQASQNELVGQGEARLQGGSLPGPMEVCIRRKDGEFAWVDITLGYLNDTAVIGTAFDITQRKLAEKEIQQQAQELATLNRISTAVNQPLTLLELFKKIEGVLEEELHVSGGGIVLYHPEKEEFELISKWGYPAALLTSLSESHKLDQIGNYFLSDQDVVLWPDIRELSLFRHIGLAEVGSEWQSFLGVPLEAHGKFQGLLSLFGESPSVFSEREIEFFKSVGRQLGIAIQNSRLFTAEKQARQVSDIMKDANLALTRKLDLNAVLDTLLSYLNQLVPYDSGNVMLLQNGNQMHFAAVRGYEPWYGAKLQDETSYEIERYPILIEIFGTRQSILVSNVAEHPGWVNEDDGGSEGIKGWMGIPLIAGGHIIGSYSLDKKVANFFTEEHMKFAEALAAQAAIAIQNALLYEQLQAGQVQLRRLTQQVVDIQEQERYRVSRELHDEAGQALTALKFSLARILSELPHENGASKPDTNLVRQYVKSAIALCESTMDQIRKLAHDLRPSALDDLGLNPALEGFCIDFEQRTPLHIRYKGEEPPNMPDTASITLYRFLQESLTNVAKHAQASEVDVHLWFDEDAFHLSVKDDGCGFDYLGDDSGNGRDQGIGLRGMQERLQLVDGSLEISTDLERGSQLIASIPR